MNTEANALYRDVERRIETEFQKLLAKSPIEKITVSQLCRAAGIHRTTFYGHYTDIYDLTERLLHKMYASVLQAVYSAEGDYLKSSMLAMLQYIFQYRSFFKSYFRLRTTKSAAMPVLDGEVEQHLTDLTAGMDERQRQELFYRYAFFTAGMTNMVERWIDRDCAETPEEILRVALHPADFPGRESTAAEQLSGGAEQSQTVFPC